MKRKKIVLGVVLSVFILVSTPALANIVQTEIQSPSKDTLIEDEINPKELLFQIIMDMAENKDIQKIVENSEFEIELNKEKSTLLFIKLFLKNPKVIFSMFFSRPVLSKDYLNYVYNLGLKISETLDESDIELAVDSIHVKNPRIQEEIFNIIEGNNELNKKMEKISHLTCGCNNDNAEFTNWDFPIICDIVSAIVVFGFLIFFVFDGPGIIYITGLILNKIFNCGWT